MQIQSKSGQTKQFTLGKKNISRGHIAVIKSNKNE